MITIISILGSSAIVGYGYYLLYINLHRKEKWRDFFITRPALHPNWICAWRTIMSMIGFILYLAVGNAMLKATGIFLFTFASYLDGADGQIARTCGLKTEFGEWLDPLCDKICYSIPLLTFCYYNLISFKLLMVFLAVEFVGQFAVREILKRYRLSMAANRVGKVKAVICFALVIYLALINDNAVIVNFANYLLAFVTLLSVASSLCKFPYSFYQPFIKRLNIKISQYIQ